MSKKKRAYGVNTFINEVHINKVDFSETYKLPEYRYIVEIVEIRQENGNGLDEMKIYTEGNLEIIEIGNWRISPVVKMPFSWSGWDDIIELQDKALNVLNIRATPDSASIYKKEGFEKDIRWVFETIKSMSEIETTEQYKLLEHINETNRKISIYSSNGSWTKPIIEIAERIDYEIETVSTIESSEKSQLMLKVKINETIDLFNKMYIRRIDYEKGR